MQFNLISEYVLLSAKAVKYGINALTKKTRQTCQKCSRVERSMSVTGTKPRHIQIITGEKSNRMPRF